MAMLANLWPGWVTSAATLLSYLIGGEMRWIAISMLVAVGLILTLSPIVYRALEGAQFIKVLAVGLLFAIAAFVAIPGDLWARTPVLLTDVAIPAETLGWALLLGALAYAGGGGGQNLCQSNWIRDKGYGMGKHAPRIVSPVTGEPEAEPGTGWRFEIDSESLRRWRDWWRFANIEQATTFGLITFLTILFTSVLAFATLHGSGELPRDISFLKLEGEALAAVAGGWFGSLFWAVGALSLFAAALGIVDYSSRLAADVLRTSYLPRANESRLFATIVWLMVSFGILVIASGLTQPLVLLVISACVAGFMMFIYSGLLILLNRRLLAPPLRPGAFRVATLVWALGLFGILSAITIDEQARRLFGF
jgi:hypothetical protein